MADLPVRQILFRDRIINFTFTELNDIEIQTKLKKYDVNHDGILNLGTTLSPYNVPDDLKRGMWAFEEARAYLWNRLGFNTYEKVRQVENLKVDVKKGVKRVYPNYGGFIKSLKFAQNILLDGYPPSRVILDKENPRYVDYSFEFIVRPMQRHLHALTEFERMGDGSVFERFGKAKIKINIAGIHLTSVEEKQNPNHFFIMVVIKELINLVFGMQFSSADKMEQQGFVSNEIKSFKMASEALRDVIKFLRKIVKKHPKSKQYVLDLANFFEDYTLPKWQEQIGNLQKY